MTIIQSIILGIVQGITEFLPISSSAHLVLFPYWLNWQLPEDQIFVFDVLVQMGTLLAVIMYYWKDLISIVTAVFQGIIKRKPFEDPNARLGWLIVLATIPAGIFGLLIKDQVEAAFSSPMLTALFLIVTAVLLILAEWLGKRTRELKQLTWLDALIIGCFQAISVFPGVSRSGSTISGGMIRQYDRQSAARFSFLMSIPIMVAAGVLSIGDLSAVADLGSFIPVITIGIIVAAVVGYLAIKWLIHFVSKHSLVYFSVYCLAAWLLTFVVSIIRG